MVLSLMLMMMRIMLQNNLHPRDFGPHEAINLLARLKPCPTLTTQASSSALHKLAKVLPFIHTSDDGPRLPAEVIRAAKVGPWPLHPLLVPHSLVLPSAS